MLSFYYPIIELVTGVMFAITFFVAWNSSFVFYLFIVSSLLVVFFADLKHGIIPDKIVYPAAFITLLFVIFNSQLSILNYVGSALGASLFFYALFLLTKGRGMGFGDVKLAFLMGLLLGFPGIIFALYSAFLTGGLVSLILLLWGKKKFGQTIPFGPFLVASTLLFFLFAKEAQTVITVVLPSLKLFL